MKIDAKKLNKLKSDDQINLKLDLIYMQTWYGYKRVYNGLFLILAMIFMLSNMIVMAYVALLFGLILFTFTEYANIKKINIILSKYLKVVKK